MYQWQLLFAKALLVLFYSVSANADTSLWKITQGENALFLGGTIHMLKPSDYPLPEEYSEAFDAAQVVYFETDMAAVQDPAFGIKVAQAMALPAGETLQSSLTPANWNALKTYSDKLGFPVEQLQGFQPAFVGITLSVIEMQRLGFSDGIDLYYFNQAKGQQKKTAGLETPDEQLEFMLAMADVDPNLFIQSTLDDLQRLPEIMDGAVKAWRNGDSQALDSLLGKPMRDEVPALYKVILTERNKAWVKEIESLIVTP